MNLRRFAYRFIGAEISTTTRFCDEVIQVEKISHDDGMLLDEVDCPRKSQMDSIDSLPDSGEIGNRRLAILINGNFNSSNDIQSILERLHGKLTANDRLFSVLYTPYASWLYRLAQKLGMRHAPLPSTFLTETELRSLCKLSQFEISSHPSGGVLSDLDSDYQLVDEHVVTGGSIDQSIGACLGGRRSSDELSGQGSVTDDRDPRANERGNLESALTRMPEFATREIEIIFVEGHSSDGTWEEIQRLIPAYADRWKLLAFRQTGKGKNDAVRLGFSKATGDLLTILDADLTMPPELLPRFYNAWRQGHGQFINGNRLVYPMESAAMRPLNLLGNRFFAKALSFVLGVSVGDSLCGTKLLARRDYERLTQWRNLFGDFDPFGDFELLFAASEFGLGIVDVPIRYRDRTYGSTNISRFRDGWLLLKMTVYGFFRLKLGRWK